MRIFNGFFSLRSPWILVTLLILLALLPACRQSNSTAGQSEVALQSILRHDPDRKLLIGAHRGGSYREYPENCLETMDYVNRLAPGTLHEVDISRTRDGVLVLMHDDALDRTTTGQGHLDQQDWAQVSTLKLRDLKMNITAYKIPTLEATLEFAVREDLILMLDIKPKVDYKDVIKAVEKAGAENRVVLIATSIDGAKKLHRLAPEMMLSITIRNMDEWQRYKSSGIPADRVVAFTGTRLSKPELYDTIHKEGILTILGTLGNLDGQAAARGEDLYLKWAALGVDMFSTDRPFEVYQLFYK
jgi:glycerophosphoryl diester phosphodiesterase